MFGQWMGDNRIELETERRFKIVIPTAYEGGIEPSEPREGDIWQNSYLNKIYVYLGNKWFEVFNFKSTGYTEQEEREMQQKKEDEESKERKELKKYKKVLKDFKEILELEV